MTLTKEDFDYDVDATVSQVVDALQRWGGTPIRSYVLSQYCSKHVGNRNALMKMLEYAVQQGMLETWEVPAGRPGRFPTVTFVNLPGADRTLPPDGGNKPGMPNNTENSQRARELVQRQYDALTEAQRQEIAEFIRDGIPNVDIQRAYRVITPVLSLIKQEFGVERPKRKRVRNRAKPKSEAINLEELEQQLREAQPEETVEWPELVLPQPEEEDEEELGPLSSLDMYAPREPEPHEARVIPVQNGKLVSHTYTVRVTRYKPVQEYIRVKAQSLEDALQQARKKSDVVEILSVSKANGQSAH